MVSQILYLRFITLKHSKGGTVGHHCGVRIIHSVFPMVIWSESRIGQCRDDVHREDEPHFNTQTFEF